MSNPLRALLDRAAASPLTPALVTATSRLTWGELAARAATIDAVLTRAGLAPGDTVGLWLPNGTRWVEGFWGVVRGDRTAVPLSTFSPPREVVRLLRHVGARALLTTGGFARLDLPGLFELLAELPELQLVLVADHDGDLAAGTGAHGLRRWEDAVDEEAAEVRPTTSPAPGAAAPDELIAVIQYTSGTTGPPKGARLPATGLANAAAAHVRDWHLGAGEALFVPNPFSHILGLTYGVVTAAAAGATTVTQAVFALDDALRLLAEHRVVAMTGAPTHLQMLADHPDLASTDLSALRLAMTGGAPLAGEWARRIHHQLGLAALVNGYGMSEVGSVAQTALDDPPEVAVQTVGTPMPGLELRVVDPNYGVETPGEGIGELWLRGPAVMRGYHHEPELTARALVDGWLRTGDLVRRQGDDRLQFVGRLADVISVGGFDVLPGDIEAVLRTHPEVAEVQVVGAPDSRLGAIPVAFLRLRHTAAASATAAADATAAAAPATEATEATIADLITHCRERLRRYMVPRRWLVVEAMPLASSGKIDRLALRRRAEQEVAQ